jgi:FKBP-type peptidyl-prolyl cis-trans isomerase FklB
MKKLAVAAVVLFAGMGQVQAVEGLDTDQKRLSYFLGLQVAQQIKGDGVALDEPAFLMGFRDMNSGRGSKLSQEEIQGTLTRMQQQRVEEAKKQAETNKSEGAKFLAANAKKTGVKQTASGLQYKVINAGKGKSPKATDTVEVHYRGTLIDGTEFDSSYKRGQPATFPVNGVIQGWQEVLPMMKEGAKWQIFVPSNLAYGERGAGAAIGPDSTLLFDIELLNIKTQ